MSIVLTTSVDISASPEQVWEVLSDLRSYGQWSNFSSIDGVAEEGTRLRIRMPGMSFRPFVTASEPNRTLEWSAKILTDGLFVGRHTFLLERRDDGTTHVTNTETFSGISVRPFQRLFATQHKDTGYTAFNHALRSRVEERVAAGRS